MYEEIKEYFSYAEKEEAENHFREDACKIKAEKAMQNLSLIRKICYNLMKLDKRFDKKKR